MRMMAEPGWGIGCFWATVDSERPCSINDDFQSSVRLLDRLFFSIYQARIPRSFGSGVVDKGCKLRAQRSTKVDRNSSVRAANRKS